MGTLTLLVNLSNLQETDYSYFFIFLPVALLLLVQTNLTRHYPSSGGNAIRYSKKTFAVFMVLTLVLSLFAVSAAWVLPQPKADKFELIVSASMPRHEGIEGVVTNLLSTVPAKQAVLKNSEREGLLFGEAFSLGDEVQFVVFADRESYWRTRVYSIYTSRGWTNDVTTTSELPAETSLGEEQTFSNRIKLTYTVVPHIKTDILLTAGEFISADIEALAEAKAPASFEIDLVSPRPDGSLPEDATSLFLSLQSMKLSGEDFDFYGFQRTLPADMELAEINYSPVTGGIELPQKNEDLLAIKVTRRQPKAENIVSLSSLFSFKPEQRYTVTSSISSATPVELMDAGEDYPNWVTDSYLQLPPTLPERVRSLSEELTSSAKTPYDKVLAIQEHLFRMPYRLEFDAPPREADGVDYFLFTQQEGNCFYFASAMTVMLRSVGVPARLVAGYLPGEWDLTNGSFTIRAKHYHAWSEVYFPGYGWVEFKSTPTDGEGQSLTEELDFPEISSGEEVSSGQVVPAAAFPQWLGVVIPFVFIGLILLVVALRSALRRWIRRLFGTDYASEVYAKMYYLASLAKLGPKSYETPQEYGLRLSLVFPQQTESVEDIIQAYQESRFGRRKSDGTQQKQRLHKSWQEIYSSLIRRLFRMR